MLEWRMKEMRNKKADKLFHNREVEEMDLRTYNSLL